jgi:hypothetical protein
MRDVVSRQLQDVLGEVNPVEWVEVCTPYVQAEMLGCLPDTSRACE